MGCGLHRKGTAILYEDFSRKDAMAFMPSLVPRRSGRYSIYDILHKAMQCLFVGRAGLNDLLSRHMGTLGLLGNK